MISNEELKKFLLENCVDDDGDLNLSRMDFSDFNGDVYINFIKVKKNLNLNSQRVGGSLWQNCQEVGGDLWQDEQEVKGDLLQVGQKVKGKIYQDKIEEKKNEQYRVS